MEKTMTRAEIKKLETIIGKVETLQTQIRSGSRDSAASDRLGVAKDELLRLLREAA